MRIKVLDIDEDLDPGDIDRDDLIDRYPHKVLTVPATNDTNHINLTGTRTRTRKTM